MTEQGFFLSGLWCGFGLAVCFGAAIWLVLSRRVQERKVCGRPVMVALDDALCARDCEANCRHRFCERCCDAICSSTCPRKVARAAA